MTPHGVLARVPVISQDSSQLIVLLFCSTAGHPLGLILNKCEDVMSPLGPCFVVNEASLVYLDSLPDDYDIDFSTCTPIWRNIYISQGPQIESQPMIINRSRDSPFHIPASTLAELRAEGYQATPLPIPGSPLQPIPWTGCPAFAFECRSSPSNCFVVRLGRCCLRRGEHPPGGNCRIGPLWAVIEDGDRGPTRPSEAGAHACPRDHINRWNHRTRTFWVSVATVQPLTGFGSIPVTLFFRKAMWNQSTLLLHMRIGEMKQTRIFRDEPDDAV